MILLKLRRLLSLIIICCFFLPCFSFATERQLIVVGEEFPPFEFIRGDQVVGLDIDIARYIFNKMDIDVKFKLYPWQRAWSLVKFGHADAILSTSHKKVREPYLWYPKENMWVSEYVFFVRKDKIQSDFRGYESVAKQPFNWRKRVGIIRGNSYHPSFWKVFPYKNGATVFQGEDTASDLLNMHLLPDATLEDNILNLVNGRIQLFPSDKIVGKYVANLLGVQNNITCYNHVLFSKGYPMPFVKNSTYPNINKIAEQYEKELIKFKKTKEYQQIIDKWLKG
ncbi:MAG: amino acid ABC transporter substrate-binding protein [Psychromonas sp.]|nr:amino acid ABC transporter substrate-binding protein [Alteromonadales bacterium]MCP5079347.1 amino acid ABC transporter substrate-binding protein [Psychromonas sp.]